MGKRTKIPIVSRRQLRVLLSLHYDAALDEVIRQARAFGWDLLSLQLTNGAILQDVPPRGAIVVQLPSDPITKTLLKLSIPVVRIGMLPHPQDHLVPAVLPDQVAAGRMAADHFLERGFAHLAHIGSDPWSVAKPMHDGFIARTQELGLPQPYLLRLAAGETAETVSARTSRFKRRTQEVLKWLQALPKPVGILVYNDLRAASLALMCHESGINLPDEVALLGYGNFQHICELSPVAISSIDRNGGEIGHQAACLLHDLMEGAALPTAPILVPPRGIVTRRSTEVLAVRDPLVAHAMRFIWDHYEQDLSVYDIAQQVGVPRYQLERAFRKHCQCGVNEELVRKRLDEFTGLLRSTGLPITELSLRCGFRTMANLHKAFKARYGMPPREYRKRTEAGL